jgi:hypothetical protein
MVPVDEVRIEIGDHHGVGGQLVVADAGRLDHQQVVAWNAGRDVTGGPDDQSVPGQLGVELGNLLLQPGNDVVDVCSDAHVAAPQRSIEVPVDRSRAARRSPRSRCMTSLAPRPK